MFDKVLFPLGLNESRLQVTRLADILSRFSAREVLLFHADSGSGKGARVRARLQSYQKLLESYPFHTDIHHAPGADARTIIHTAETHGMNSICFSWKRKAPIQRLLLGSTTQDVVRQSPLPVFVYKKSGDSGHKSLSAILYATTLKQDDSSRLTSRNLKAGSLILLHVGTRAPDPRAEAEREQQVQDQLNDLQQQCQSAFHQVKTISAVGRPSRRILQHAKAESADMIILGKHEAASPLLKMLGSTAEQVAHRSRCSILILPPAGGVV
ncbi:MAG: universal stress protein [candidate division KSB1 bacterium]|nr:universal stress protein [candidate division KSB1 bacterium]